MIDRPKKQDQIDLVLQNLQLRFAKRLMGIPFQDLKSLVQAAFSVEEAIARGLWTYIVHSPNSKGKKQFGSFNRSRDVGAISYQHQRPAHHSPYRPPIVRAHFSYPQYQYQSIYVQKPYVAQASMQPRPSHPRTITHSPLRPYAQRPVRQFTPLSMTLTRAFEKFRDGGLIVPLASRPLPYPHRLHYLWTYTRAYPFRPSLLASSFQLTFGFGSLDRIFHPVSLSFRVGTTPISIGHCLISQSLGLHLY